MIELTGYKNLHSINTASVSALTVRKGVCVCVKTDCGVETEAFREIFPYFYLSHI